jgi:uncharacterized protein YjdB
MMKQVFRATILVVLALGGACGWGTEPPGAPARIVESSATTRNGPVGTLLPDSLVVRVVDAKGRGVPRHLVDWAVGGGHGTISPSQVVTDDRGYARASWVLGERAGSQVATASTVTTEGQVAIQFTTAAEPGPTVQMYISPPSAALGVGQTRQLSAVRRDAYGNPILQRSISWTTSDPAIATVDAGSGLVTGVAAGSVTIAATSERKVASALVTVVRVVSLAAASDTIRTGVVGTTLTEPLAVKVIDAQGRPVAGETVTWSTTRSGSRRGGRHRRRHGRQRGEERLRPGERPAGERG